MVRQKLSQALIGLDVSEEEFELMVIVITWFILMYKVDFYFALAYIYG